MPRVPVDRRGFLKGAATATAAAGTSVLVAAVPGGAAAPYAEAAPGQAPGADGAAASPPTAAQIARDAGDARPPAATGPAVVRPGSDVMVDVLRGLGIEYVAANPGSSFEGLQESIINSGEPPNRAPEFITALHEESAVTMAHGYAKATGRPMVALLHGTIGVQHGAMSIYQAYCDRVPVVLIAGREEGFIQAHTAADMAGMVRSYTKWDAQPGTLGDALEAIQRAYTEAVTPPMGPTMVVLDSPLQKLPAGDQRVPTYQPPRILGVDAATARDIAGRLLAARNPRIEVGRLRTPEGVDLAVRLAELVGASTSTAAANGPMSFPQRHPLCGPGSDTDYDYVLGLETRGAHLSIVGPGLDALADRDAGGIRFGVVPGAGRGGRGGAGTPSGPVLDVDAEASLPGILGEVSRQITAAQQQAVARRARAHADANRQARLAGLREALEAKRAGWDASPVSTARLYAELWPLIQNEDWCLASPTNFSSRHHVELWDHDRPYSYLGTQGAAGMGYGAPASIGAGLAARSRGRIVVNVQCDGDLNYAPGVLWTAVHHRLPVLTVMHNNRAWHQELMFVEYMCGVRGRGTDRGHIGTTLRDPFIDYARMAQAYGMAAEGPIEGPADLSAALRRGVDSVKRGMPYLVDVVTQPR
jgi:thiamine pyrophosphate-dependent acetolactate synthase large subunit-like protein